MTKSLATIKEEEAQIFGSTKGRSRIQISLIKGKKFTFSSSNDFLENWRMVPTWKYGSRKNIQANVFKYLGYGPIDNKGRTKQYIAPRSQFQINIRLRNPQCEENLIEALKCISVYSGLGSRSRNGFGRFSILSMGKTDGSTVTNPSFDHSLYFKGELSSFTAFSKYARHFVANDKIAEGNWEKAIGLLCEIYKYAREDFEGSPHSAAQRQYICTPVKGTDRDFPKRHAKVHFFGIEQKSEGMLASMLHLPYKFLDNIENAPEGKDIRSDNLTRYRANYMSKMDAFNEHLNQLFNEEPDS